MIPRLFAILYLLQLARATSTNTTTTGCPSCDATSCSYRSVWSLLASCGITLLICVWHAIHPAIPLPHYKRSHVVFYRLSLMLVAFFTPEYMIMVAFDERYEAKRMTKRVHDCGYEWWTMTHSHFVLIGGFVLRDKTGIKEIKIDEFLSLVEAGDIVNPVITEDDIKDKSTSDGLAKAILIVQLSWFTTQIVVRLVNHLAVTLVELDTVCMALLTLPLIFFWWEKPCCPGRPHIFYTRNFVNNSNNQELSQRGDNLEKLFDNSKIRTSRDWADLLTPANLNSTTIPFFLTWITFAALHAIAWNYEFPTEIEKTIWRVSSLTLAGMPIIYVVIMAAAPDSEIGGFVGNFLLISVCLLVIAGVISRLLLVALMLASLRSLPFSAYQTVPWTNYIPHL